MTHIHALVNCSIIGSDNSLSPVRRQTYYKYSQWTHDALITSWWRQNDIATSFWRNNDVIIAPCIPWDWNAVNCETGKNISKILIQIQQLSLNKRQFKSRVPLSVCLFVSVCPWNWHHLARGYPYTLGQNGGNIVFFVQDYCRGIFSRLKHDSIGFRSGFSRREISSVYLWCRWQRTKIERRNSMRNVWIKA